VSANSHLRGTVFQHFLSRTGEHLGDATVTSQEPGQPPARPAEFTEGTSYRARIGGRRRPMLTAALVFGVTMTGVTVYELESGDSFSGGKGTTVGAAVTGHDASASSKSGVGGPSPADSPSHSSNGSSADAETPSASDDGGTPTPAPSTSATDPALSSSSRSGSADQDPADPAAP
jgi:hypothetical protein